MDAGIVSQNIAIFCASVGLITRPRAEMNREKLREKLVFKLRQKQTIARISSKELTRSVRIVVPQRYFHNSEIHGFSMILKKSIKKSYSNIDLFPVSAGLIK